METTVGSRLLDLLARKGLSQADLSRRTGYSKAAISDVISGRRNLGTEFAIDISKALDIPPEDFLRMMSILPPKPDADLTLNTIEHLYHTLEDPDSRQQALKYMEFLKTQEDQGKYNAGESPKP